MRIDWRQWSGVFVGLAMAFVWQSLPNAVGQTGATLPPPRQSAGEYAAAKVISDEDPFADEAMLTERGKQLVDQLVHLRRIESTLGKKHPSMPEVQAEIEVIRSQLQTWSIDPVSALASQNDGDPMAADQAVEDLSTQELRRLLLQMAVKIDRLETRIGVLERRARRP